MYGAVMFVLAVAALAWGASLATYRWVALQNAWPLGNWQAEQPMLARLIGLAAVVVAVATVAASGGAMVLLVILLGLAGAIIWTVLLKVGAQSALVLAPADAVILLVGRFFGG